MSLMDDQSFNAYLNQQMANAYEMNQRHGERAIAGAHLRVWAQQFNWIGPMKDGSYWRKP